jgi:hypothetical protein
MRLRARPSIFHERFEHGQNTCHRIGILLYPGPFDHPHATVPCDEAVDGRTGHVTHGSHAQPLGHRAKLCRQNGRSVFFCRLTPRRRKPSHANTGRRMGKIAHGWAEHATVLMLWRLRLCASERCPFPPAAHDCAVPAASVALPAHPCDGDGAKTVE